MMGLRGLMLTIVPTPHHSALLQLKKKKKPKAFAQKTCGLKLSCVHDDIKPRLSLRYSEIDDSVTSLIVMPR